MESACKRSKIQATSAKPAVCKRRISATIAGLVERGKEPTGIDDRLLLCFSTGFFRFGKASEGTGSTTTGGGGPQGKDWACIPV